MSRQRFIWDRSAKDGKGDWVPFEQYRRPVSSHLYVQSDFSEPVLNMADGQRYGSKRFYRDALRAHGCVEVGNEALTRPATKDYRPQGVGYDIKRALER
jgi:hypothetical protein